MKTVATAAVIGLAACLSFPSLAAEKIALAPLDGSDAVGIAERKAVEDGLTSVEIYPDQSFAVEVDGRPQATFVIARADSKEAPNAYVCFLAYAPNGAASPTIVPTVGSGNYETTSCNGVEAVSTAIAKDAGTRLVVLFQSQSPNAEGIEPIVFDFAEDVSGISIDEAASSAASDAGATTIKTVKAAIAN